MICPKCGASLPDTAELCWSCRKTFVPNVKLPEESIQPTYRLAPQPEPQPESQPTVQPAPTQTTSAPLQMKKPNVPEEEEYFPPNYDAREKAMRLYSHLGYLGIGVLAASVSNKYYARLISKNIAAYRYNYNENVVFAVVQIAVVAIFFILIYLNSYDRYISKDDALGKVFLSLLGLVYAYFFTKHCYSIYNNPNDWDKNTYVALQLMLYGGYTIMLLSGLMTYPVAYTLDEKSKLEKKK